MAEYVHLRTEEMIPELEKMQQLRIFEKHEIRAILKKRKEFEYKIQRRTKCKEDYLRYIQYEMDILKTIKLRRENMNLKKTDVEYQVAHKLHKLFKTSVSKFGDDIRIWISYFKFCKQVRFHAYVGPALMDMLRTHSDKPNLWAFAANWEFTENHSVENARQFLLRGLRFHPKSKDLYTEAFKLELQYAAMKREQHQRAKMEAEEAKKSVVEGNCTNSTTSKETQGTSHKRNVEEVSDQVLEGRLVEMIFESASKKIQDVKFLIDLLTIAKEYDFTDKLQSKMVEYMLTTFSNDELTWDTMARRELEGLSYTDTLLQQVEGNAVPNPSGSNDISTDDKKNTKNCLKERIRSCCGVYTAVVKQLPTERMWSLYLETLLELNQDQTHLPKFKKNLLREAFQGAHSAGCLQEKYYLLWVDMLKSLGKFKKLEGVLRTATERIPSSIELWQARLRLHLARDDERVGLAVFRDATARMGSDNPAALPLWKIMLHYYQTKDMHKVEQMFQEGIVQGPAISLPLKPMYIEWLVLAKGIVAARKMYETMSIQPPLCLELHTKMAALEGIQPDVNLRHVRRCHEMACDQFGKNNTDVWMEFVKFEQKLGDAKKVSDIYNRAVNSLDTLLTDSFISEFSMVKTGLIGPNQTTI